MQIIVIHYNQPVYESNRSDILNETYLVITSLSSQSFSVTDNKIRKQVFHSIVTPTKLFPKPSVSFNHNISIDFVGYIMHIFIWYYP